MQAAAAAGVPITPSPSPSVSATGDGAAAARTNEADAHGIASRQASICTFPCHCVIALQLGSCDFRKLLCLLPRMMMH